MSVLDPEWTQDGWNYTENLIKLALNKRKLIYLFEIFIILINRFIKANVVVDYQTCNWKTKNIDKLVWTKYESQKQ